jgi:hypothetical protein
MKKSSWWTVVLIFAFQTSAWALSPLNQYFNLVAGEGEAGFRDGDFSNALFKHPTDVAASEDGELLFVADRDNHRIRCVLLSGKNSVITLAGTGVAGRQDGDFTTATFNAPSNLALLPGRRLLVYDSGDGSFRLIFLEKQKVITIPAPDMKQAQGIALTGLYGMVYDPETHFLYFSQPDSQTLRRLDVESGVFETVLEKNDKIPNPYALCLYKKHLCVADRNLPAVFQVEFQVDTPTATPTPTAGGTPAVPAAPAGSAAPAPSLPVSLTQVAMGDHVVSMTENDGILYAFQAADVAWIRLTSTDKIPSGEVKFMSIWAPYLEPKTPALDALMSFKDSANAPA